MASALITNSPDLSRLRAEDYEMAVRSGLLVISNVPYLNAAGEIVRGVLVSPLSLSTPSKTGKPENHVVHFSGSPPCELDGTEMTGLGRHGSEQKLLEGLTVNFSFSNKPTDGYPDYYQKMTRYIDVISAPAKAKDPTVSARTAGFKVSEDAESPLVYIDTNSSRALITAVSEKLKGQRIAIVGLGGTGAYVLDSVAKTPVAEIHLFDDDDFRLHNAYRSPGAPLLAELESVPNKVEYYQAIYSRLHKRVIPHVENLNEKNVGQLAGFSFVFVCIDVCPEKKAILDFLLAQGIPFSDTGIGIFNVDQKLRGTVRTTTVTAAKRDHIDARIPMAGPGTNDYATNIQISELNMLNAAMAVLRWKKLLGFYADERREHHVTYTVETNSLVSDEIGS
jgi:hypothetical protein